MSKSGASAKQSENPQAANPAIPAWIQGLCAVLLIALLFTYNQMVQVQQSLDQANNELADMRTATTEAQIIRAKMVKQVSSLKNNLTAAKNGLGRLEGELKDANTRLKLALTESKNNKIAAEKQQKLALRFKQDGEKQAVSLREKLSAEKTRFDRLEGELKDANTRLEGELKDANSRLELALAVKTRLGRLEGELKDTNTKLEGELKDANSRLEGELKDANTRLELALTEKTRLGRLEGELKDANTRLELALAEKARLGRLEGELKDANSRLALALSRLELALAES